MLGDTFGMETAKVVLIVELVLQNTLNFVKVILQIYFDGYFKIKNSSS